MKHASLPLLELPVSAAMLHLLTAGCGTFETSTDVRYMAARAETYVIS